MKRGISLLLILALLLSCATAYAYDANNTTLEDYGLFVETIDGVPQFAEVGPNRLTEEDGLTIRIFCDMNENSKTPEYVLMTKWYEAKTNVRAEWVNPAHSEIETQLTLNLASGNYCDLYFGIGLSAAQVMTYVDQGIIASLSPYIAEYGPNFAALIESDKDVRETVTAPDGEIYTWSRSDGALHTVTPFKLYVYEPWVEQLGMETPDTIDEFYDYLVAVRDGDVNGNGDAGDEIPFLGSGFQTVKSLMNAFETMSGYGCMINVREKAVYPAFTTDAYRAGLTWMKKLYDEGLLARDTFVIDATQLKELTSRPNEMLVGASAATYSAWFSTPSVWAGEELNMYKLWRATGPLAGSDGEKRAGTNSATGRNSFISTTCAHPEVCVGWIDYFFGREGAIVVYKGFEGSMVEWSDSPSISGVTPSLHTIQSLGAGQNFAWGCNGPRLQTSEIRSLATYDETTLETAIYLEGSLYTPYFDEEHIGNLWFDTAQSETIAMLESAILTYVEEASVAMITGDKNIESDWDGYVAQLEAMGLAEWLAVYQAAYDTSL